MTSWSEDFARADVDLDGAVGFVVSNNSSDGVGIEIFDTYATNDTASEAVIAYQTSSLPETLLQRIRALVAFETETPASGTDNHAITVGLYGRTTDDETGYGARLTYANADVRTLEIVRENNGAFGAVDTLVTKTLTTEILSVASSDLLVSQEVRLIATTVEGGTRLRAYINQEDDDYPTLEHTDYRDPFELVQTTTTFGIWYFFLDEAAARALKVLEIHGDDIVEQSPAAVQIQDRHTLSEIRANVLTRVDGSSVGTDRAGDTDFMNEIINSTVEEILDDVGDVALFMQPVESLTLTAGADRVATMPSYVNKVISIVDVDLNVETPWNFLGYTSDETVQIIFDKGYEVTGRTTRVHYQMKYARMDVDTDLCPIPRRFTEAVVYGAIMRISEYDTNDTLHKHSQLRYEKKVTQIKKAMNRMLRAGMPLRAKRRVQHIPFGKHLTTPITGY